jgi:hypothetical protein
MTARVGPVLHACRLSEAVIAAIREENPAVEVIDRGAYLRVLSPGRCVVRRAAIEAHAGAPFRLPSDLESIMSSFAGRLHVTGDEARWEAS